MKYFTRKQESPEMELYEAVLLILIKFLHGWPEWLFYVRRVRLLSLNFVWASYFSYVSNSSGIHTHDTLDSQLLISGVIVNFDDFAPYCKCFRKDLILNRCETTCIEGRHRISTLSYPFQILTAVCRIMFDLPFNSSKSTTLKVIGGAEGVLPHPNKFGSK